MTIMPLAQGEQCFEDPRILKITESTINQYQCCRGQTSQAPRSRAKKRLLKQRVSMFPKQMMIQTFLCKPNDKTGMNFFTGDTKDYDVYTDMDEVSCADVESSTFSARREMEVI